MPLTCSFPECGAHHDRFWFAVVVAVGSAGLAPQGFGHAVGGVLAERGRDVRVARGLAQLRVAEDLLDDADADALLEQEGRSRVAGVMYADVPDSGLLDK